MLLIPCPWCGPRDEIEFRHGGEAHLARPSPAARASDMAWSDYLFVRTNAKGIHAERWVHAGGCEQWFNLVRDTATHEIAGAYLPGRPAPETSP